MLAGLDEVRGDLGRLLRIEADRAIAAGRRAGLAALVRVWIALLALAASLTAAVLLVLGLAGAFTALLGAGWAGRLAGAVGVLGGGALALHGLARARERRRVAELRRKYADLEGDAPRSARPDPSEAPDDGGASRGPRGPRGPRGSDGASEGRAPDSRPEEAT